MTWTTAPTRSSPLPTPTAGGACTGTGVGPTKITRVVGVSKAYVTRVGEGPFPTELLDESGEWLRQQGHEYGVTTGRPRRCGWFDAVVNRYASQVNGLTDIVLTKLDVLTGLKEIPICVAYDVNGERRDDMPTDQAAFAAAKPIYETMPGWDEDISNCHSFDELPATCQAYVKRLEELSGCRISAIGTGPQRDHPSSRSIRWSTDRLQRISRLDMVTTRARMTHTAYPRGGTEGESMTMPPTTGSTGKMAANWSGDTSPKWKMASAGILVGLISGFVVLYRLGIEYGTDTAPAGSTRAHPRNPVADRTVGGRRNRSRARHRMDGQKSRWLAAAAFRKPTAW